MRLHKNGVAVNMAINARAISNRNERDDGYDFSLLIWQLVAFKKYRRGESFRQFCHRIHFIMTTK